MATSWQEAACYNCCNKKWIQGAVTDFGTKQSYIVFIPVNVSEKANILRVDINYHF